MHADDPRHPDSARELATALTRTYEIHYRELLEGVPEGEPTWVTSGGAAGGLHGTLGNLTAEQASQQVNGTTLAAHVEHLMWAIQLVNNYFRGEAAPHDWSESWSVNTVNADAWQSLQEAVQAAGDELLAHLSSPAAWDQEIGRLVMLASYGHSAYHLGAIRQLAKAVSG